MGILSQSREGGTPIGRGGRLRAFAGVTRHGRYGVAPNGSGTPRTHFLLEQRAQVAAAACMHAASAPETVKANAVLHVLTAIAGVSGPASLLFVACVNRRRFGDIITS